MDDENVKDNSTLFGNPAEYEEVLGKEIRIMRDTETRLSDDCDTNNWR